MHTGAKQDLRYLNLQHTQRWWLRRPSAHLRSARYTSSGCRHSARMGSQLSARPAPHPVTAQTRMHIEDMHAVAAHGNSSAMS